MSLEKSKKPVIDKIHVNTFYLVKCQEVGVATAALTTSTCSTIGSEHAGKQQLLLYCQPAITRKQYKIDAYFLLKSNRKSYATYQNGHVSDDLV